MMTDLTRAALVNAARDVSRVYRERNEWIAYAYTHGAALREIAGVVGLSHQAVAKILNADPSVTMRPRNSRRTA